MIRKIRTLCPRVHCITNPVTIRDCANILLACGASPIMAHHPEEAASECVSFMNRAAEAAEEKTAAKGGGTMTFFTYLIDSISQAGI